MKRKTLYLNQQYSTYKIDFGSNPTHGLGLDSNLLSLFIGLNTA